ncbi:MAG TPA: hypothetical protein VNR39_06550 [Pseudolabrys sp.]|nr:hypothetical protein [Pseudolabrys sp.]
MSFASRQGLPGARLRTALVLAVMALGIAGCSTTPSAPPEPPPPPVIPTLPPAFPSQAIVGNWGLAAYHREEDRVRTENNAAGQCRQPYVIGLGPTGGVMMHLADQSTPTELRLKGAPGGKTYIGPADDPPASQQDREVVQFDGRVLILRWMDPEVQGRYGNMIYVRCGAEGSKKKPAAKPRASTAKPKPAPKPAAR